jgi:hypothetical protein
MMRQVGGIAVEDLTQRVAESTGMRQHGESRISANLVNASIALVMFGWVLIWLGWIVHGVWKITGWLRTGTAPKLTLRDLGATLPHPWPFLQSLTDFVLDAGLGLLLFIAGTAVYVIFGGVLLFLLFVLIRTVEILVRGSVGRVRRRRPS